MAIVFKVKALYDFEAKEEDDLGFPGGQVIDVTEEVDGNWLEGRYTDAVGVIHSGIFPREFVEKYEPPLPARPSRPARKQEAPASHPASVMPQSRVAGDEDEYDTAEASIASNPVALPPESGAKPPPPPSSETIAPPSVDASSAALKSTVAEPPTSASSNKKPPPPVAAKSNAFKDRIAAFNQSGAAPVAPMPSGKPRANEFIKRPFVAPPPSANSYVPLPRTEQVHKPYSREDDPEIRQRLEEDRVAAEAAGLAGDLQHDDEEDTPKPTSLKDRIARLQQQQLEQAQRRAEPVAKSDRKLPSKKVSGSVEIGPGDEGDDEESEYRNRDSAQRQSLDVTRDRPPMPSSQRRPAESVPPTLPEHDLVSDGNDADQSAAGETTDDTGTIGPEDSDDTSAPPIPTPRAEGDLRAGLSLADEEDTTQTGEVAGEDGLDEEARRRVALRERMAKMSGGMGMPGMFGGAMPLPSTVASKRTSTKTTEDSPAMSPPLLVQKIPMLPGAARTLSPERGFGDEDEDQEEQPPTISRRSQTEERSGDQSVPQDLRRPAPAQEQPSLPRRSMTGDRGPPPIPGQATPKSLPEFRQVPPPPGVTLSPGPGSESDDEASIHAASGTDTPGPLPSRTNTGISAPPIPTREILPRGQLSPDSNKRASYLTGETAAATDRRASRAPPPVPGAPLVSPRPPPPPPPDSVMSGRQGTGLGLAEDDDEVESGNEGDYDTDIASSVKHKDALKAHARDESLDNGSTTADEISMPGQLGFPSSAIRAVPPPPPVHGPPKKSIDLPRGPPPVPPRDEEYDPYRINDARSPPAIPATGVLASRSDMPRQAQESSDDDRPSLPVRSSIDSNRLPFSLPQVPAHDGQVPFRDGRKSFEARKSLDVNRAMIGRNSSEQVRSSFENSFIATEIPLNHEVVWWTDAQPLPPAVRNRRGVDILVENDDSTSRTRGGQSIITKNMYILFADYSETSVSARYDASKPEQCELQQSHRPPPAKLRQDQLEAYWQRFGKAISDKVASLAHASNKKDALVVGDGTPMALVTDFIQANPDALAPIGCRSFGALVYANLGNASVQQFDEIRAGDVVSLRGARFDGHHGAMKTKYRQEYTNHVAIVEEWDGTKKAIRIFEQGREAVDGKKDKRGGTKSDKLRLTDLRSGEVRVWRVIGRDWVGWVDDA